MILRHVDLANRVLPAWLTGCICLLLFYAPSSIAQSQPIAPTAELPKTLATSETYRLWNGPAPGASVTPAAEQPTITVYRPPIGWENGTAVVIAPGGAYVGLSGILEGTEPASWFTTRGVTAFVLSYRTASVRLPTPFLDGARAIRFVRANAGAFGIDPSRIGMMGFSAGGHLAATTALNADNGNLSNTDPVERVSSRPDFLILVYPWLEGMVPRTDGQSSYCDFVKEVAKTACRSTDYARYVPLNLVKSGAPPTFIFHTADDGLVPASGSVRFYLAMLAARVPVELHVFQHGPHGMGMGGAFPTLSRWPDLLQEWLRGLGVFPTKADGHMP